MRVAATSHSGEGVRPSDLESVRGGSDGGAARPALATGGRVVRENVPEASDELLAETTECMHGAGLWP